MTASELRDWLKEEQSQSSGWTGASGSGETVGHERLVDVCWYLILDEEWGLIRTSQRTEDRGDPRAQPQSGSVGLR